MSHVDTLITSFVAAIFILAGCSGSGPSSSEIKQAITESADLPSFVFTCNPMFGPITIEDVVVVDRGVTQGEGTDQYWPVRARVSGHCYNFGPALRKVEKQFEDVKAEYRILRDDYGAWTAYGTR